jgi:hypothetical protein
MKPTFFKAALVVGIAGAVLAAGTVALAGHLGSDVKSYTGCLSAGGTLSAVAEGDAPRKECPGDAATVHLSGGDITGVAAGPGLTGGGTNGTVTLGLDAGHSLPQECQPGEIPKADDKSAWTCGTDNDHQYFAGQGLSQSGNTFGLQPSFQLPQGCNFGQIPERRNGFWGCADQQKPAALSRVVGFANVPQSGWTQVAAMPIPAGQYFFTVSGFAEDDASGNNEVSIECQLFRDDTRWADTKVDIGDEAADSGPAGSITMTSILSDFNGGVARLYCTTHTGSDHLSNLAMTAIPIGQLTTS